MIQYRLDLFNVWWICPIIGYGWAVDTHYNQRRVYYVWCFACGYKQIQEFPGMLNWAIQGCLSWQEHELQTLQVVEDQVAEYRSAMDSISQFIRYECDQDSTHMCAASKFFQA